MSLPVNLFGTSCSRLGISLLVASALLIAGCGGAPLTGIGITPSAPSISKGTPVTFTATGTYSDGSTGDVSGSVTWASSDTTVATLNASGIASTLAQGSTTITASMNGVTSNSATLTVSAPQLATLSIMPFTFCISQGNTKQYTATGTMTDGTAATLGALAWTSSDPGVGTIDGTGLATGVSAGKTNISASGGGVTSNSATLTVWASGSFLGVCSIYRISISITPAAISTSKGSPVTFTATGTYSDGSTNDDSGWVTWASSDTTVATLNASGIASTLAQGSTTITASMYGVTSNSASLTVTVP